MITPCKNEKKHFTVKKIQVSACSVISDTKY